MKSYQVVAAHTGRPQSNDVIGNVDKISNVKIKMIYAGICGTDYQVFSGNNRFAKLPLAPLHEGVGEIVEIYDDIEAVEPLGLKIGDRVVIDPIHRCGQCHPCRSGQSNACANFACLGVQQQGLAARYVCISAEKLLKVAATMESETAVLAEPLAVAWHAVNRLPLAGLNIAVLGAGTIGNFVAQSAVVLGATVAVIDNNKRKVDLAGDIGLRAFLSESESITSILNDVYPNNNTDVFFECTGAASVLEEIIAAVPRTSSVVIIGNHKQPLNLDVAKIQRREIAILGSITYLKQDIEQALRLLEDGRIESRKMISNIYPFERIDTALRDGCRDKGIMRSIIKF